MTRTPKPWPGDEPSAPPLNEDTGDNSFSVVQFFNDEGTKYIYDLRWVTAEAAGERAVAIVKSVAGQVGTTRRVIVTDGLDCICFDWEYGKGVVFPTEEQCRAVAAQRRNDNE